MHNPILGLPLELIDQISTLLPPEGAASFGLTCSTMWSINGFSARAISRWNKDHSALDTLLTFLERDSDGRLEICRACRKLYPRDAHLGVGIQRRGDDNACVARHVPFPNGYVFTYIDMYRVLARYKYGPSRGSPLSSLAVSTQWEKVPGEAIHDGEHCAYRKLDIEPRITAAGKLHLHTSQRLLFTTNEGISNAAAIDVDSGGFRNAIFSGARFGMCKYFGYGIPKNDQRTSIVFQAMRQAVKRSQETTCQRPGEVNRKGKRIRVETERLLCAFCFTALMVTAHNHGPMGTEIIFDTWQNLGSDVEYAGTEATEVLAKRMLGCAPAVSQACPRGGWYTSWERDIVTYPGCYERPKGYPSVADFTNPPGQSMVRPVGAKLKSPTKFNTSAATAEISWVRLD